MIFNQVKYHEKTLFKNFLMSNYLFVIKRYGIYLKFKFVSIKQKYKITVEKLTVLTCA